MDTVISKLDTIIRDISAFVSGSGNSDVINSANQNTQDIITNQNTGNQAIKDNADKNASDIQQNQDANTDKVTEKLEETKTGIISGLIDGIKGLFLPSDDYFQGLFTRLNDFFSERFGFLYVPIDLLIRFCELLLSSDTSFAGVPFPEIAWEGQVIIPAQKVGFDMAGSTVFSELQDKLYFVTNLIMIGALLALIHRKFDEVMRN